MLLARQSIGEPGTQLTMRTFHIGGAASGQAAQDNIQVNNDGVIRLHNIKVVDKPDGSLVAVSRSGELSLLETRSAASESDTRCLMAPQFGCRTRPAVRRAILLRLGSAHTPDHH